MIPVQVVPFTAASLYAALANGHATAEEIAGHGPAKYLYSYLNTMQTATMVVEDPYTDADFLDDFTAYYARCFSAFGRRCKRLHFFRCRLTPESFSTLLGKRLQRSDDEAIRSNYLGFVVARPLPEKIIGRSVLRTYDDDKGTRRHFPVSRSYEVNLFGLNLTVNGLAYQEQDEVLAACATVALWSAFHKTGDLFGTAIPTPAVITRAATQASHYGRPIPQHGLRMEEMCSAIRHNGL